MGGVLEPPVTPIGRDELALKRHRFFTDLLSAAQAAAEHRVCFDPLGPNITIDTNSTYGNYVIYCVNSIHFIKYICFIFIISNVFYRMISMIR